MWIILLIVIALIGYAWYMLAGRYRKMTFEECVDRCLDFMDDFDAARHHTLTEPQQNLAVKKAMKKHAVRVGGPGLDSMCVEFPVCVEVTMLVKSLKYAEKKLVFKRVVLWAELEKKYRGCDFSVTLNKGWMTERKAAKLDTGYRVQVRIKGKVSFKPYNWDNNTIRENRFYIVPDFLHWNRID